MPFVEIYKEHAIHASAWEFPGKRQWEPHVFVTWNDGSQMMDKLPNFIKSFSTREEAERYGITFARKWIDDGKPPLA